MESVLATAVVNVLHRRGAGQHGPVKIHALKIGNSHGNDTIRNVMTIIQITVLPSGRALRGLKYQFKTGKSLPLGRKCFHWDRRCEKDEADSSSLIRCIHI
ncbi:hypothetical protein CEXT_449531 [Caerostris extrusa]|uniref:Uncharacterized protein n=1 Tax=Caerostris extrusa TaxID=172846 RepID=A0AAV4Q838_CAEEX|nr:hypothetical protein CEXT_449531 [Caerostris extrusa]